MPEDLPEILELYGQLTGEKPELALDTAEEIFDEITVLPDHVFLVAAKEGQVLGTLYLQIVPNLSHGGRPWGIVENMVVDRDQRRQGIGRLMMDYALKRCHETGCYKVQLLSNRKRREAHEFYRALGFEDSAAGFRLYF